jgi:predicted nucleic acid-binding protein
VILVDTSVWIEVFRARRPLDPEASADFDDIATRPPVIQEVLQGFREESAHRRARRAGRSVRSSVDCRIAACAIRHDLEVLHRDRDFASISQLSPLRHRTP